MLFQLPVLKPGIFIERINRFAAKIKTQENEIIVHVGNSGRMKELLIQGTKVWWEPKETGKTKGSLWLAEYGKIVVVLHAATANKVFSVAVEREKIERFKSYQIRKSEFVYKNSRFDFLLENTVNGKKALVEVKSVNLSVNGIGLFPDAPTQRGTKHVTELNHALRDGYECFVVFMGLRTDIEEIRPYQKMDPDFTEALKKSAAQGVEILGFSSHWNHQGCSLINEVKIDLKREEELIR